MKIALIIAAVLLVTAASIPLLRGSTQQSAAVYVVDDGSGGTRPATPQEIETMQRGAGFRAPFAIPRLPSGKRTISYITGGSEHGYAVDEDGNRFQRVPGGDWVPVH